MTDHDSTPNNVHVPSLITQKQLQALKGLREAKNLIEKQVTELRDEILIAYQARAEVESGKFGLRVRKTEMRSLTQHSVAAVVGDEMLAKILRSIEPRTSSTVLVDERSTPARPLDALNDNRPDLLDDYLPEEQGHGVSAKEELTTHVSDDDDFH